MKRTASVVAAALVALAAFAQGPQGPRPEKQDGERKPLTPEERIEMKVNFMKDSLGLTDEQAAELTSIFTKQQEAMAAARESFRQEMEKIRTECSASVGEVLTPEQQEKYSEMPRGPRPQPGMHRHHPRHNEGCRSAGPCQYPMPSQPPVNDIQQ